MHTENNPSYLGGERSAKSSEALGQFTLDILQGMHLAGEGQAMGPYSHMKESLRESIVGQDEAIDVVVDVLNHEEFRDDNQPIGTFMFLGPTGVGKSQTAKEVARALNGDRDGSLVKINCTQFKTNSDLSVLHGAPPKYVGYDQKPLLDKNIIEGGKSVVLFDEVEKADPSLHDFLLDILDDGEITVFNEGKNISFRNSIIILTSNAGSKDINSLINKKYMGFSAQEQQEQIDASTERLTEVAFEALKKAFRPEFLGRIENKVLFSHLSDDNLGRALQNYVKKINSRTSYQDLGVHLAVSPELTDGVVKGCARRHEGGFREVKTNFRQTVERDFEKRVMCGSIPKNSFVYATPASEASKHKNPDVVADFHYQRMIA